MRGSRKSMNSDKKDGSQLGDSSDASITTSHLESIANNTSASLALMAGLTAGSSRACSKVGNKMAPPIITPTVKTKSLDGDSIANLEKMLRSENADDQLEGTKKFRQLLFVGENGDPMGSVTQDVLGNTIVPQLLYFLGNNDNAALQVEALWALTSIAAGTTEHTKLLIKYNAVPTLVDLLSSDHQEVLEQAVWVLGNIAGDSSMARDQVLGAGALKPLLVCMRTNKMISLLRIATWTLSNLCDLQPRPLLEVDTVLQTLRVVLLNQDTEVLSHACWALSHLCDGPSPHIQAVVNAEVCPRLVDLLHNKSWRVVKPALRTVGNIVCAEDERDYTQHIIDCGAVPCLKQLIEHSNREIQKEACWTLSNIAAGTIDQIQCVIDSGSIPTLIWLASKNINTDPDVRIEACWVLLNATSCGSESQIQFLVNAGCVTVLCTLLDDNSMVMMALEGIEKILQVGEDATMKNEEAGTDGTMASLLDTAKIDALQKHRSNTIAKRARKIWKQHFVVCAICHTAFSRKSPLTEFCAECKCSVCNNCNCSVYHLSYQDALWKDFAEDEALERSKMQSKKSKKKKKQKAKDKKSNANQQKPKVSLPLEPPVAPKKLDKSEDQVADGDKDDKKEAESTTDALKNSIEMDQKSVVRESSHKVAHNDERGTSEDKSIDNDDNHVDRFTQDGDEFLNHDKEAPDYVEFLSNTGSILDLWKLINETEGVNGQGDDVLSEDQLISLKGSTM